MATSDTFIRPQEKADARKGYEAEFLTEVDGPTDGAPSVEVFRQGMAMNGVSDEVVDKLMTPIVEGLNSLEQTIGTVGSQVVTVVETVGQNLDTRLVESTQALVDEGEAVRGSIEQFSVAVDSGFTYLRDEVTAASDKIADRLAEPGDPQDNVTAAIRDASSAQSQDFLGLVAALSGLGAKIWEGTYSQYLALGSYDPAMVYFITDSLGDFEMAIYNTAVQLPNTLGSSISLQKNSLVPVPSDGVVKAYSLFYDAAGNMGITSVDSPSVSATVSVKTIALAGSGAGGGTLPQAIPYAPDTIDVKQGELVKLLMGDKLYLFFVLADQTAINMDNLDPANFVELTPSDNSTFARKISTSLLVSVAQTNVTGTSQLEFAIPRVDANSFVDVQLVTGGRLLALLHIDASVIELQDGNGVQAGIIWDGTDWNDGDIDVNGEVFHFDANIHVLRRVSQDSFDAHPGNSSWQMSDEFGCRAQGNVEIDFQDASSISGPLGGNLVLDSQTKMWKLLAPSLNSRNVSDTAGTEGNVIDDQFFLKLTDYIDPALIAAWAYQEDWWNTDADGNKLDLIASLILDAQGARIEYVYGTASTVWLTGPSGLAYVTEYFPASGNGKYGEQLRWVGMRIRCFDAQGTWPLEVDNANVPYVQQFVVFTVEEVSTKSGVFRLDQLATTEKGDLVGAMNEIFQKLHNASIAGF
jgi:hypothetical protein